MRPFRRKKDVSFHRPQSEAFRLDTRDVEEGAPFWATLLRRRPQRDALTRYIAAGGTRDARDDGQDARLRRSWRRFALAFAALALAWALGAWL